VLLLPLLLLASPGRAVTRSAGSDGRITRAHTARVHMIAAPMPGWEMTLAVAADFRAPVTTTTTTTIPPTTTTTAAPREVPQVRAAAVTPTTAPPPPPTTTTTVYRPPPTTTPAHEESGQASWYNASTGTCASPNLAFGTVVTVTNTANGLSTTCTVDDRMDPSTGRVLDMSEGSFAKIADPSQGVIEVRLTW